MGRGAVRVGVDVAGGVQIGPGSPNVTVNGKPKVRIGDLVAGHGLSPHSPAPPMATGSGNVLVNGIPACRTGDIATCGHATTGSGNVTVN